MIAPNEIIYLDNNATTRVDSAVLEEMLPFLATYYGNPSSGYSFGSQVRDAIELARERVATLLGCAPSEIVFTSGGTEATAAALSSALQFDAGRQHIVTTAVEHSATLRPCEERAKRGGRVTFVGVDGDGKLDLAELENAIQAETAIVSTMGANNETGVLFPVEQIAEVARSKRVLSHIDAVQVIGKIPVCLADLPINYASISAHKLHGPKGVGALYIKRRSAFRPSLFGGGQENNRRAGTENVASIVGFGKAAELARETMDSAQTRVRELRDRFEATLLAKIPSTFVNGSGAMRLPNTSSLSFTGIDAEAALIMLDQQQVCCSAGSACRTGAPEKSHVLRAMHLSEERINSSLRFSCSRFNTEAEIDRALDIIPRVIEKLRTLFPAQAADAVVGAVK